MGGYFLMPHEKNKTAYQNEEWSDILTPNFDFGFGSKYRNSSIAL